MASFRGFSKAMRKGAKAVVGGAFFIVVACGCVLIVVGHLCILILLYV